MIQAIGLTSASRRGRPPVVDDLTFEARPGGVTALLGPPGAGKSAALRLMLQLSPGCGVALFRGRPMSRVPHPSREIGTLLGTVPAHPRRTVRGQLRMLAAAGGMPACRADDVLDIVGLSGLANQHVRTLSRGMDRRLGLAVALLGDPHTLVLDDPASGLSRRETAWLHGLLRGYADRGGTVLVTSGDPEETARLADHVVSLDAGRLIADQNAADFERTRLRPRVVVRTPHADRLAAALAGEFRARTLPGCDDPVQVVRETGSGLAVYGSDCAAVGEIAYRHRVVVHQLADAVGDSGDGFPAGPLERADGREAAPGPASRARPPVHGADSPLPPRLPALPPPGPSWPLRYELRRWAGVRTVWWLKAAALVAGLVAGFALAAAGDQPAERVLTGWAAPLPLPPAAIAAGLLGALSFGQEFRYPALAPHRVPVPRRLSLLTGKLLVASGAALILCCATVAVNSAVLLPLLGPEAPEGALWPPALQATAGLSVGCAWAGVLAAGLFRSALAGLAAVAAVPLALAPVVRSVLDGPAGRLFGRLPGDLPSLSELPFPSGLDRWVSASVHLASQPVGWALALSLGALLCGYALVSLRGDLR